MTLLPIFLKLEKRRCVVVGAGRTAESKITGLLKAKADVTVVAPEATERVKKWARNRQLQWQRRSFRATDLDGALLVVSATSSPRLNQSVFSEARRRGILCNAVDDPERCDFFYGAVVRRGDLQIAISTTGASPCLAQRLRRDLERQFTAEYAAWLEHLRRSRSDLRAAVVNRGARRRALQRIASRRAFLRFNAIQQGSRSTGEFR